MPPPSYIGEAAACLFPIAGERGKPLAVAEGGDFAGADFGAQAPEYGGVEQGDAAGGQVGVDGGFVGNDFLARGGMHHAHNLGAAEFGAAAAPVAMGHADVAAAFSAGAFFHAGRDGPMEESGGSGAGVAAVVALVLVVEEGGKASDDLAGVERFGDAAVGVAIHAEGCGARFPGAGDEFRWGEAFFEAEQHGPVLLAELWAPGALHGGRLGKFITGFQSGAAGVAHAQGKHTHYGQGNPVGGADVPHEELVMLCDTAAAGGYLQRGPEAVGGARGGGGAAFAENDMTGEGVVGAKPGIGAFQLSFRHLPGDEGAFCQAGGKQGLAHTADGACGQHGPQAADDFLFAQVAALGNRAERVAVKSLHGVFCHAEEAVIHRVGGMGRVAHSALGWGLTVPQ